MYKIFKKNGTHYILCNILLIFIFSLMYYFSYNFLINNKEFCKKYNLGVLDKNLEKINIFDAISLSLVTQSTIGYSDVINKKQNTSLSQINSNLLNFINTSHMIIVILTIAYFI